MAPLIDNVLAIARGEIGVHEVGGNNRGQKVEQYQAATGGGAGDPWCADFVAWCLARAGVPNWLKSGYTPALETWAKQGSILHNEKPSSAYYKPQVGDVFLLCDAQGPYHTGLVTSVDQAGARVGTIEGNTGGPSDADGDGVYAKSRMINQCEFIRWIDLPENAGAAGSGAAAGPAVNTGEVARVKIFEHDNRGTIVIDGTAHSTLGIKMNGQPWGNGEIEVAYRKGE